MLNPMHSIHARLFRRRRLVLRQLSERKEALLLIHDEFTDVEDTALSAHNIAPVNVPSASWVLDGSGGALKTKSNRAALTSTTNDAGKVDAGAADVTAVSTITLGQTTGAGNAGYLQLRIQDADNLWRFAYGIVSGAEVYDIQERNAGSNTVRATGSFSFAPNTSYSIKAQAIGFNLKSWINGANMISYTSGFMSNETSHGIRCVIQTSVTNYPNHDDFKLYSGAA